MRIISKFKDYYDALSMYGVDMTEVFVRDNQSMDISLALTPDDKDRIDTLYDLRYYMFRYHERVIMNKEEKKSKGYTPKLKILYFCGKLYPFFIISYKGLSINEKIDKSNHYFIYNNADVEKVEDELDISLDSFSNFLSLESNIKREKGLKRALTYIKSLCDKSNVLELFNEISEDNKLAYFLVEGIENNKNGKHNIEIQTYPILKDIDFAKIKDGSELFQEIEGYLFGHLMINNREMIEVSDEIKASKYGHDGKYSFKTPPKN